MLKYLIGLLLLTSMVTSQYKGCIQSCVNQKLTESSTSDNTALFSALTKCIETCSSVYGIELESLLKQKITPEDQSKINSLILALDSLNLEPWLKNLSHHHDDKPHFNQREFKLCLSFCENSLVKENMSGQQKSDVHDVCVNKCDCFDKCMDRNMKDMHWDAANHKCRTECDIKMNNPFDRKNVPDQTPNEEKSDVSNELEKDEILQFLDEIQIEDVDPKPPVHPKNSCLECCVGDVTDLDQNSIVDRRTTCLSKCNCYKKCIDDNVKNMKWDAADHKCRTDCGMKMIYQVTESPQKDKVLSSLEQVKQQELREQEDLQKIIQEGPHRKQREFKLCFKRCMGDVSNLTPEERTRKRQDCTKDCDCYDKCMDVNMKNMHWDAANHKCRGDCHLDRVSLMIEDKSNKQVQGKVEMVQTQIISNIYQREFQTCLKLCEREIHEVSPHLRDLQRQECVSKCDCFKTCIDQNQNIVNRDQAYHKCRSQCKIDIISELDRKEAKSGWVDKSARRHHPHFNQREFKLCVNGCVGDKSRLSEAYLRMRNRFCVKTCDCFDLCMDKNMKKMHWDMSNHLCRSRCGVQMASNVNFIDTPVSKRQIEIRKIQETRYVANISVGVPAQYFNLLLDVTRPHLLVTSSDCLSLGCWFRNTYDRRRSNAWVRNDTRFKISWDWGSVEGRYSRDAVGIEQVTAKDVTFGEILKVSSFDRNWDGVLGLSLYNPFSDQLKPLTYYLKEQGQIADNSYSLYLSRQGESKGSYLVVGGVNLRYDKKDFTYFNTVCQNQWVLPLDRIKVGSNVIEGRNLNVLIDNNVEYLAASPKLISELLKSVDRRVDCDDLRKLPDIELTINGKTFNISPSEYVAKVDSRVNLLTSPTCRLGWEEITNNKVEENTIVLGGAFLKSYYVHFDLGNRRVGFAKPKSVE